MIQHAETLATDRKVIIKKCQGFQNSEIQTSIQIAGQEPLTIYSCEHCYHGEHCFFCESTTELLMWDQKAGPIPTN